MSFLVSVNNYPILSLDKLIVKYYIELGIGDIYYGVLHLYGDMFSLVLSSDGGITNITYLASSRHHRFKGAWSEELNSIA